MKKVIVGIASTPDRELGLLDTIKCLANQCDRIYVWLNGYTDIPTSEFDNVTFHVSEENIGAVGKVKLKDIIEEIEDDFYYFTCDDDILYPDNYIQHNISVYEDGTIQSCHTALYKSYPIVNYYKETERGNNIPTFFTTGCNQRFHVHLGGTGVMMFDSEILRLMPVDDFLEYPNMLDPWVAAFAHENDIAILTVVRSSGWLLENKKIDQSNSIFKSDAGRGEIQTQVLNHYFCAKPHKFQPVPILK